MASVACECGSRTEGPPFPVMCTSELGEWSEEEVTNFVYSNSIVNNVVNCKISKVFFEENTKFLYSTF